ncbi:NAD-binding protein [Halosolutus amylolyticus]|uniref:NAD-binding protein n=1 Tax=Halosolutus amylolyticus TaxID=2932267 RepID=A0ABD5PRX8_9EURY|nr:NAD-binding protein [Halosolutus amylolyticus]
MLDRVRRHGAPVAVWIVVTIALVSIATGILSIPTEPSVGATGTLGVIQAVAEFSGTVLGFTLLVTAWGMHRGFRVAYVAATVLVALEAVHGVAQFRPLSIPLVVTATGGFVLLLVTSDRFTRSSGLTPTQLGSLVTIVGVFCYGTVGAYALRSEFDELHTVADAVYFTLVTATTVGYGDVHAASEGARLFATSLVLLGPATVAVAAGSLFGPMLDRRLSRTGRGVATVADRNAPRIVVLGYDERAAPILDALAAQSTSIGVVTSDDEAVATLEDRDVDVTVGDPTDGATLDRAGIDDADVVLAATDDAASNSYAVLTARDATDARIVAVADREAIGALERAGADVVLVPEQVLANATIDAALGSPARQSAASAAAQSG